MGKRILVIEDDMISFVVAKSQFLKFGYEVEHAMSGEQGIERYIQSIADDTTYNAIYMDLGLPKISGINACLQIREYERENNKKTIPIIAVTANDNHLVIDECIKAGMMDVIFKPFTAEKLIKFQSHIIF